MIAIDFETKWGLAEDLVVPVEGCGGAQPCILAPIAFSAPPRPAAAAGGSVDWVVGPHHFSMRRQSGEGDRFVIRRRTEAMRLRGQTSPEQISSLLYDADEGLVSFRAEPGGPAMVRCRGRLTFEDLEALLSSATPRTSQPPDFFAPTVP